MGQLIEFPLAGGGTILVESTAAATSTGPVTRGGHESALITERAQYTFEEAIRRVEPAARTLITHLRELAESPDEIKLEFGLDLHAEAGAFIASASTTANFKVGLVWRRERDAL